MLLSWLRQFSSYKCRLMMKMKDRVDFFLFISKGLEMCQCRILQTRFGLSPFLEKSVFFHTARQRSAWLLSIDFRPEKWFQCSPATALSCRLKSARLFPNGCQPGRPFCYRRFNLDQSKRHFCDGFAMENRGTAQDDVTTIIPNKTFARNRFP